MGLALTPDITAWAVSSYLAFSPLPRAAADIAKGGISLWRFPSGHPAPPLAGILSGGARTFLHPEPEGPKQRPPSHLARHQFTGIGTEKEDRQGCSEARGDTDSAHPDDFLYRIVARYNSAWKSLSGKRRAPKDAIHVSALIGYRNDGCRAEIAFSMTLAT